MASSAPARGGVRPTHDSRAGWLRDRVDDVARTSPARLALTAFAGVVLVFTALLLLPEATASGQQASLADALFTAVSAVCVTGLVTVDTATYWSAFGEGVILVAIQTGGLGVLTLASLLGLAVSRRLGLRQRLIAATETKAQRLGEVGGLIRAVVLMSLGFELVLAAVLVPQFWARGEGWVEGLYHGVFYAVSAFNNAGFVSHADGFTPFVADTGIVVPVALGVLAGSLGFPVLLMLTRHWRRPSRWDLHTRMTLSATMILLLIAIVGIGAFEWNNPRTFGALDTWPRLLAAFFQGVMPRSGGFATVSIDDMYGHTWLLQDMLMFVGGGSASTAGGIRVTTLAVLVLAVVAEARGDRDVELFSRRVPQGTLRLAIAVLLIGATVVAVSTMALLAITDHALDVVLFETISAFATSGLSTGITGELPDSAKYVLSALMFVGRTGTMTVAAALALRERSRLFRLPEERPIVG